VEFYRQALLLLFVPIPEGYRPDSSEERVRDIGGISATEGRGSPDPPILGPILLAAPARQATDDGATMAGESQ